MSSDISSPTKTPPKKHMPYSTSAAAAGGTRPPSLPSSPATPSSKKIQTTPTSTTKKKKKLTKRPSLVLSPETTKDTFVPRDAVEKESPRNTRKKSIVSRTDPPVSSGGTSDELQLPTKTTQTSPNPPPPPPPPPPPLQRRQSSRNSVKQRSRSEKKLYICWVIICCLIIMIILGLVLGLVVFRNRDSDNNNNNNNNPNNVNNNNDRDASNSNPSNGNNGDSAPPPDDVPFSYPTSSPVEGPQDSETSTPTSSSAVTSPTLRPTLSGPIPAPVLTPTSLLQPTSTQIIVTPYADTYIYREGFDRFEAFGDEDTFLVQNGPSIVRDEIADAIGLIAFDLSEISSTAEPQSFTLRLYHEPLDVDRGSSTLQIRRMPSTVLFIESLHSSLYDPDDDEGVIGPSFVVSPDDTIIDIDITDLVFAFNSEENDDIFLLIENKGDEQVKGAGGDRFFSRETNDPPQLIISILSI